MEPALKRRKLCKAEDDRDAEHTSKTIADLPVEVLCIIARYLGVTDLVYMRGVSRLMRDVADDVLRRSHGMTGASIALNWQRAGTSVSRMRDVLVEGKYTPRRGWFAPMTGAIRAGNIQVIEYLLNLKYPWSWTSCKEAAIHGHAGVLGYLRGIGCHYDFENLAMPLIDCGHTALFMRLYSEAPQHVDDEDDEVHPEYMNMVTDSNRTRYMYCKKAAREGNTLLVKFLCERGSPVNERTYIAAVKSGSVETVQYLQHVARCDIPDQDEAIEAAAKSESMDMFKLILARGVDSVGALTFADVARCGTVDMMKLLRARGCAWDTESTFIAAMHDRLDALAHLIENGCPADRSACRGGSDAGSIPILEYLHKGDCASWPCAPEYCRYGKQLRAAQ